MARGLDVGTCFLVGAKQDPSGMTDGEVKSVRDAFIEIDNEPGTKNMLKMSKIQYIESDEYLYIIGDPALRIANMFKKEVRRPLSKGVISAGETDAEKILLLLLKSIVAEPDVEGEVCFYSVPAAPIDRDMDILYHKEMFRKIVSSLGFTAEPMNEAAAIVYSNAAEDGFTALASSFGAGMVNTALLYQTMIGMEFSVAKSGDWIDENAARAVGKTSSQIMAIKERGVNLLDPSEGDDRNYREREAIIMYYRNLIINTIDAIRDEFKKTDSAVDISEPLPWILSGGTSQPKNFLKFFQQEFDKIKNFPIPISEIRMANDPLNDVAKGLLVAAINFSD